MCPEPESAVQILDLFYFAWGKHDRTIVLDYHTIKTGFQYANIQHNHISNLLVGERDREIETERERKIIIKMIL